MGDYVFVDLLSLIDTYFDQRHKLHRHKRHDLFKNNQIDTQDVVNRLVRFINELNFIFTYVYIIRSNEGIRCDMDNNEDKDAVCALSSEKKRKNRHNDRYNREEVDTDRIRLKKSIMKKLCKIYPTSPTNGYETASGTQFVTIIDRINPRLKSYSCYVKIISSNANVTEMQKISNKCNRFIDYICIKMDNLQQSLQVISQMRDKFYYTSKMVDPLAMTQNGLIVNESSQREASVIVFDLDDTLIDGNNRALLIDLQHFVTFMKRMFTFVVMWSHGTCEHVHKNLKKHNIESCFDMVIARTYDEDTKNKGLGYVFRALNKQFRVTSLTYTALVDDLPTNYTNDYDFYLQVPTRAKDVPKFYKYAIPRLEEFIYDGRASGVIKYRKRHRSYSRSSSSSSSSGSD